MPGNSLYLTQMCQKRFILFLEVSGISVYLRERCQEKLDITVRKSQEKVQWARKVYAATLVQVILDT